jgi:ribosome-binding factor A
MPREFKRSDRVADALQRELASLIREEVRDPRLAMINVTGTDVSRDISFAKVYVNFIAPLDEREQVERLALLNKAAGFIRSRLMKRMRLRVTPRLNFCYDDTGQRGRHLSALIEYAVAQDINTTAGEDE